MPTKKGPSSAEILTSGQVAEMFAVTVEAVGRWADEGKLPCFRTPGGSRRFRRVDVEVFLSTPTTPTATPAAS